MNKSWQGKRYNSYPQYIKETFGERVQKLSINAGFTCPNRDGALARGGCTYCNNQSFNPDYCHVEPDILTQVEQGAAFFRNKYPEQKYLAYFQAYTNTYADLDTLKQKYEAALAHPHVLGLVIGTRPDCISEELLQYLQKLQQKYYVAIEYGIESTLNKTLQRINRGHNFECSKKAIELTDHYQIPCGAHLIIGLPGETREEILSHADTVNKLPLKFIKLHQLQLIRGTQMAEEYNTSPENFHLYSAEEYIRLIVDFIERLAPHIIIERFISQSPKHLLIAPHWGLKNFEFVAKVEKALKERDTWQGKAIVSATS